jgi:RNA polymerase sigma factor (sigma-70 family)
MPKGGEYSESHIKRDVLVAAFLASSPVILRHVMIIVKRPEDAEDVMQETIYSALKTLDGFKGGSQLSTWLYRIAHNKAVDRVALAYRHHEVTRDPHSFSRISGDTFHELDNVHSDEIMTVIEELRALSPAEQKVVFMQVYGFSIEEIAAKLDMKSGTVKSHASRGKAKLRQTHETT